MERGEARHAKTPTTINSNTPTTTLLPRALHKTTTTNTLNLLLTLFNSMPICRGMPKSSSSLSMSPNFISLPAAPRREMTPAERSSVACCPVGMMVSSPILLRAAVR